MKIWLDAQLSPAIAIWLSRDYGLEAYSLKSVGLRDAKDRDIFFAARSIGAVIVTKDVDFVRLLEAHGAPPQVLWLTCGNTSNAALRTLFAQSWERIASLLAAGEALVELS